MKACRVYKTASEKGQTLERLVLVGMKKVLAMVMVAAPFVALADAPTDITGVTSAVSGYVTAGIAVGVAVLLFVLGRRVIRRVI